jgi:hypothetical protein
MLKKSLKDGVEWVNVTCESGPPRFDEQGAIALRGGRTSKPAETKRRPKKKTASR